MTNRTSTVSRFLTNVLTLIALSFVLVTNPAVSAEENDPAAAQTIWRLLDYIAVDYPEAIDQGRVVNELEYAEMVEFCQSVETRLADLSPKVTTPQLMSQAQALRIAIADKAPPEEVAGIARGLARDLLESYPVPRAPTVPSDLARGAALYAQECASCHGQTGQGDGPLAEGMEPPPIDFTDVSRASQRSIFSLYQVTTQGLEETPMTSFDWLAPEDRWALAFYVGGLGYTEAQAEAGEQRWTDDSDIRTVIPDLEALVQTTPATLGARIGESDAQVVMAYLRSHPDAVVPQKQDLFALAKSQLAESAAAYMAGDHRAATDLALSAYLDGVEPREAVLSARDAELVRRIEEAMIAVRDGISRGVPIPEVQARIQAASRLLDTAAEALEPDQVQRGASFIGAFTILVREGLEAILIVVAMLAFLQKAERREIVPFVHGGWVAALAAGVLTWFAATYLVSISGAGRELTEGIGALTAAVVLVSVGIWMHGKSHADAWQKYIAAKMSRVLSRRSAWFLFILAFIVVYREVFETILFFIALWSQGNTTANMLGAGAGLVVLAGIAWSLMAYSRKLPVGQFFLYSSVLIAVLAVILAGKGVAALQEAGWLDVRPIAELPRIELLGLYPTWQGVTAQLFTLGVLTAAFWYNEKSSSASARAAE